MTEEQKEALLKKLEENPEMLKQYYQKIMRAKMQRNIEKYKPVTNKQYMAKDFKLKDHLDKDGGMHIMPTPKMVLKMWTDQGEKVFINLLSHYIIDEPE